MDNDRTLTIEQQIEMRCGVMLVLFSYYGGNTVRIDDNCTAQQLRVLADAMDAVLGGAKEDA